LRVFYPADPLIAHKSVIPLEAPSANMVKSLLGVLFRMDRLFLLGPITDSLFPLYVHRLFSPLYTSVVTQEFLPSHNKDAKGN